MNKDEIIEEMAKEIDLAKERLWNAVNLKKDDYSWHSKGIATALYNANCRIIADDEMVIKKSEHKALLLEQKRLKEMVDRIPCGYVKIADDEIIVKKRQYEQLKKYNRDRKRLRLRWQQAKQETAREILQEMYDYCKEDVFGQVIVDFNCLETIARKYGIELE